MNPLAKILSLFYPAPPLLSEGQRIEVIEDTGANYSDILPMGIIYYVPGQYCTIKCDMKLIYYSEDKDKIYFRVRANWCEGSEAKDNSIIYFTKKNFKNLNYRKT